MRSATRKRTAALLAIVAAMIVWGSTFVVTKAAMQQFPPITLAFLRFAIACALLLPFQRRGALARTLREVSLRRLAFLAFTGVALFTVGFNYALIYGSAAQGALLYAGTPAVVAICAVLFLRERLLRRRALGIALTVAGAVLIVATGEALATEAPAPIFAAIVMVATIFLWGVYTVVAKPIAASDQTAVTFVLCAIAALLLVPPSAIELAAAGWPEPRIDGWLGALYLGALATAAAYALYNFALRELDASTAGALTSIDPVVGLATAILFLGESLTALQTVGAAVVLVGMWLAATEPRRRS